MAKSRTSLTSLQPYINGRRNLKNLGEIANLATFVFNGFDSIERAKQGEIDSPEVYFGEIFALSANTLNDITTGPFRAAGKLVFGQEAIDQTPIVAQLDQKITGRQVVDNIESLFEEGPKRYFGCAWNILSDKPCE